MRWSAKIENVNFRQSKSTAAMPCTGKNPFAAFAAPGIFLHSYCGGTKPKSDISFTIVWQDIRSKITNSATNLYRQKKKK